MTPELYAACDRSVHVIRADGHVLHAGRAVLFILEQIGWGRFARLLSRRPFIWPVELGYKVVAQNRSFFARFMFRNE